MPGWCLATEKLSFVGTFATSHVFGSSEHDAIRRLAFAHFLQPPDSNIGLTKDDVQTTVASIVSLTWADCRMARLEAYLLQL